MSELIDTTEMYLKTVYELEEDGVPPLRARIVERLDHSGPTVSQTVARMERDGLIKVADDRSLQLTEEGRRRATEVIRKHRLAERLLLDVIGMDRRLVHEEACRWEHVMSEQVEERLAIILDDVSADPFGNPIPPQTAEHPRPSADEVEVAAHDAQCRRSSGWSHDLYDQTWDQSVLFYNQHRAELDPMLAEYAARSAHYRQIITQYGGTPRE